MINSDMVFTDDSINIFTDASMMTITGGESVGCSGYVTMLGQNIIDKGFIVNRNSTNNNSEIKAVKLGVMNAAKYQHIKNIRLFSDSQICIYGIRDRVYKWIASTGNKNELIGYDGTPIKNQDIFIEIIYFILNFNVRVEFYHQRGHINISNPKDIEKAKKSFILCNGLASEVSDDLIEKLSYMNNYVDNYTRDILKTCDIDSTGKKDACRFLYNKNNVDSARFRELTHPAERKDKK